MEPLDLPPEPHVDTLCLFCEQQPQAEGQEFCPECQSTLDIFKEMEQQIYEGTLPPADYEDPHWRPSFLSGQAIKELGIQHRRAIRTMQAWVHEEWEMLRDELSKPLPQPLDNATQEQWFEYRYSFERHKLKPPKWGVIATCSGYSVGTLRTEYYHWKKRHNKT